MDQIAGHGVAGLLGGWRTVWQGGGVATTIRLLGPPALLRDGVVSGRAAGRRRRGRCSPTCCSASARRRARQLAAAVPEPRPARRLRWNLAQLRRVARRRRDVRGRSGASCSWRPTSASTLERGRALLEGSSSPRARRSSAWLRVSAGALAGQAEAVLHDTALAELAAGRAEQAAELAARLVASRSRSTRPTTSCSCARSPRPATGPGARAGRRPAGGCSGAQLGVRALARRPPRRRARTRTASRRPATA